MAECLDVVHDLPVEDAPIGDHQHGVEKRRAETACPVRLHGLRTHPDQLVREPRERVALPRPRRMLDEVPLSDAVLRRIVQELVHHVLCLFDAGDRDATYADSRFCPQHIRGCVVVHQSEVVFQHIAFGMAQRVVRFVSRENVVGVDFAQSARHEAVIPVAVAKEQQILGFIVVAFGFVVKHLHETADGCGVRRTGREFVVNLVNRDD